MGSFGIFFFHSAGSGDGELRIANDEHRKVHGAELALLQIIISSVVSIEQTSSTVITSRGLVCTRAGGARGGKSELITGGRQRDTSESECRPTDDATQTETGGMMVW